LSARPNTSAGPPTGMNHKIWSALARETL
jgi:hypothetical protein